MHPSHTLATLIGNTSRDSRSRLTLVCLDGFCDFWGLPVVTCSVKYEQWSVNQRKLRQKRGVAKQLRLGHFEVVERSYGVNVLTVAYFNFLKAFEVILYLILQNKVQLLGSHPSDFFLVSWLVACRLYQYVGWRDFPNQYLLSLNKDPFWVQSLFAVYIKKMCTSCPRPMKRM